MKNQIIGLGTAAIGRPTYINIRQEKTADDFDLAKFKANGVEVLEMAYQQGVRYFDTAPNYGMAEALLMHWVKSKADNNIEVATKWGYSYIANFNPNAKEHEHKEHSLKRLNEQWQVSKSLLPYLTTYQIHSATFQTKVLENEAILNRLMDLKLEHGLKIGTTVTGDNQNDVLKKALDIQLNGQALFDAFQVTYNIFDQSLGELVKDLKKSNKRIIIKEGMANGRVFPNVQFPHYKRLYDALEQLAKKYQVGIDAIALRFIQDSINPFRILSGAAIQEHIIANLKANDFELTADEIALLQNFAIAPKHYWQERKQLTWN
jgi:aryl-alcohol dehydrogenase-like predicted oxidoreductase